MLLVAAAGWMSLWALTNPIGAAPDEPSHYAKTVAAGHGDLRGKSVPIDVIRSFDVFNDDAISQVRHSYRSFQLEPAVKTAVAPPCTAFRADLDGRCLAEQAPEAPPGRVECIVGAYPPWLYLPGGLVSRFASSVDAAYPLTRLTSAAVCVALFAAAMWLLVTERARRAGQTPVLLTGLALGCTPMTIFLSSSTGASGPEAVGALASAAAALRLSARELPDRATWVVAGAVLAVTAASRPIAPLWVVLALAFGFARLGWRGIGQRLRTGGRAAKAATASVFVGVAGSVAWTQSMALRMPLSPDRLDEGFAHAVEISPRMMGQAIGVFGWQELPLPAPLRWAWGAALVGIVGAAVVRGRRRDAVVTVAAAGATVGVYLLLAGTVFYQNGLGMQGRYVLPALAMVPLVAATTLADPRSARLATAAVSTDPIPTHPSSTGPVRTPEGRHRRARRGMPAYQAFAPARRLLAPRIAGTVLALTGIGQALAWAVNARRYAVGVDGPVWFPAAAPPAWSPTGGWPLWTLLACLLALLTAGSGALAASSASLVGIDGGRTPDSDHVDAPRPGTPLRMPAVVSAGTPPGLPGRPPDPRSAPPGAHLSARRRPRWAPLPVPPSAAASSASQVVPGGSGVPGSRALPDAEGAEPSRERRA